MPTYEYLCKTCSHRFETWQKMTDEPLTVCPECGGHIRRVLYPAGIVFKGSGFYKTDHPSGSAPAEGHNGHDAHDASTTSSETPGTSEKKESPAKESSSSATPAASTSTGESNGSKVAAGSAS